MFSTAFSTNLPKTIPSLPPPPLHSFPPIVPSFSLPLSSPKSRHHQGPLRHVIRAIDAAQPFDYESQLHTQYVKSTSLKIAVIGFGNFGQFLAKAFARHHHTLLVHSRSDHSPAVRQQLNAPFFADLNDLCELHPDVVLLSTSILSTESVLKSIPFQRLKRSTLFVDVLSVKEFPRNLFLKYLPQDFDILCTHPMFGPESAKSSCENLPFMYDKVRIGNDEERIKRVDKFLDVFAKEGCRMVEMSCFDHDKYAAGSQFVTHTMGRVLERFGVESSPINTKGYETLLDLVDNTKGDSFDLYYGLFMYNKNSLEQLQRLEMAFESIKQQLFGQMFRVYRKELFGSAEEEEEEEEEEERVRLLSAPKETENGAPVEQASVDCERLEGS